MKKTTKPRKVINEHEEISNKFKSIKKKIIIFIISINILTILMVVYSLEYIALLIPSICITIVVTVLVYLCDMIIQSYFDFKFKENKRIH